MKKVLLLVIASGFLLSCGPHRMKCGPRGICENQPQKELTKKDS